VGVFDFVMIAVGTVVHAIALRFAVTHPAGQAAVT
jgi:hypothetical protein